jgi:hypothetical protein
MERDHCDYFGISALQLEPGTSGRIEHPSSTDDSGYIAREPDLRIRSEKPVKTG